MRKIFVFICLLANVSFVSGQDSINKIAMKTKNHSYEDSSDSSKWKVSGFGSLNFNQASFNNWASGGQNSVGLSSMVSFQANYQNKKQSWKNNLNLAYGFQLQGNGSNPLFTKTDDKIEFNSIYGYSLAKTVDFSVLVNFRTQFANGYNYPNDSFVMSKIRKVTVFKQIQPDRDEADRYKELNEVTD